MTGEGLQIQEVWSNDECEIQATGDLIITNAKSLQKRIDETLEQGNLCSLILNLENIQYIDSFGIGVIVKTKAEIDKKRGALRVRVNQTLYSLFQKCHLDDYIDLELSDQQPDEN